MSTPTPSGVLPASKFFITKEKQTDKKTSFLGKKKKRLPVCYRALSALLLLLLLPLLFTLSLRLPASAKATSGKYNTEFMFCYCWLISQPSKR